MMQDLEYAPCGKKEALEYYVSMANHFGICVPRNVRELLKLSNMENDTNISTYGKLKLPFESEKKFELKEGIFECLDLSEDEMMLRNSSIIFLCV